MERVVIFDDYANTEAGFRTRGAGLDHQDLLDYLSEGRFLVEAHAFVPIDPRNPHARDALIERLWGVGYLVHAKTGSVAGDGYRCNLDVEITLELMRTAEQVGPDIIVLVSGDKDFVPVILELRRRGIRVEAAAFPQINAARELMQKASGFIDLERYVSERDAEREAREASVEPLGPLAVDDADSAQDPDATAAALPWLPGRADGQERPGTAIPRP